MMGIPKIGRNPGHDNCIGKSIEISSFPAQFMSFFNLIMQTRSAEIRRVRRALKRKYKYDYVCFLRLTTNISTTGSQTIKVPQRNPLSRAKSVKRLFPSKVVSYRNASLRCDYRTIIMHLRKSAETYAPDLVEEAVKVFRPIGTAF
jgi:hypothetical protein